MSREHLVDLVQAAVWGNLAKCGVAGQESAEDAFDFEPCGEGDSD